MSRRVPIFATLLVLAAVATMVGLGIWQLQRAQWKADLLERYRTSQAMSSEAPWPRRSEDVEKSLYRHTSVNCARVLAHGAVAGRSAAGESGWAQVARCRIAGAGDADVVLGWSLQPVDVTWQGGPVSGIIGPGRGGEARLVAAPPLAGLEANAAPDPSEIPNNHLAYAGQWFFFAITALVIYALALRKRWREREAGDIRK